MLLANIGSTFALQSKIDNNPHVYECPSDTVCPLTENSLHCCVSGYLSSHPFPYTSRGPLLSSCVPLTVSPRAIFCFLRAPKQTASLGLSFSHVTLAKQAMYSLWEVKEGTAHHSCTISGPKWRRNPRKEHKDLKSWRQHPIIIGTCNQKMSRQTKKTGIPTAVFGCYMSAELRLKQFHTPQTDFC